MKTHHNYVFIQILRYFFLFTTLFKLVASSFWKKVADSFRWLLVLNLDLIWSRMHGYPL